MKQSGRQALISVMSHGSYRLKKEIFKGHWVIDKKQVMIRRKNSCDRMLNHRFRRFNKVLIEQQLCSQ